LNVGGFIGDENERVVENIERSFEALGRVVESKHDVWQVHSDDVHIALGPRGRTQPVQADILISNNPEVSLFMRFADCVPIMAYDPKNSVIAIVHAGWKGVTLDAPGKAINALSEKYGTLPGDLLVGLGPAICGDCYPIGIEVADKVESVFQGNTGSILSKKEGQIHLDLPLACHRMLKRIGVKNIEMSEICTAENLDYWFSHRAENGTTGRFGALLALRV
jgi:YfiH family protein